MEREVSRSEYQVVTKAPDGEYTVHNLEARRYASTPEVDEQAFITNAAPTKIYPSKRVKPVRSDTVSVIIPDLQIGFRGGEAFHDERAMKLGLIACRELQPNNIVLLGDNLDLPTQSKFDHQGGRWTDRIQPALDTFHTYLSQIRADNPSANMVVHWGNHDLRLKKQVQRYNGELMGLRRANAEQELGVLTLQFLLRTDELDIKAIDSYPRGSYWLEDNIETRHGFIVRSSGNSAQAVLTHADHSIIFGHVHRREMATKTLSNGKIVEAVTPGTFARIDGTVPSYHHTIDESDIVVKEYENWQQGLAVVHHNPRNHQIDVINIDEGRMNLYGEEYTV